MNHWNPEIKQHICNYQTPILCKTWGSGCIGLLTMGESLILDRLSGALTTLICYCNAAYVKVPGLPDSRMGIELCETDFCKTAKMRIGSHSGPILEIFCGQPTLKLIFHASERSEKF